MNDSPADTRRPGLSRFQKLAICCILSPLVILILAIIGGVIWYGVSSNRVASALRKEIAAVRESGAPLNAVELHTKYHAEPKRAAAVEQLLEASRRIVDRDYQKTIDHFPIIGTIDAKPPPPGQEWPQLAEIEALLTEHDRLLQLVKVLPRGEGAARFPVDFRLLLETKLDYVQALRATARFLTLKFHVELHKGRIAEALDCVHQQFALAELAFEEPLIVPQLVCVALNGVAMSNTYYALQHAEVDDAALQELQTSLRRINPRAGLRCALEGERALYYTIMSLPTGKVAEGGTATVEDVEASARQIPARAADASLMLSSLRRLLEANETSLTAALAEGKQLDEEFKELAKSSQRIFYVHTLLLVPALPGAGVNAFVRSDASCRSLDALIAAICFHRAKGNWPTALDQLVPDYLSAVPLDAYSGKPLLIKSSGEEFKVYSVGENQLDDGGQWGERDFTDVGFAIEAK